MFDFDSGQLRTIKIVGDFFHKMEQASMHLTQAFKAAEHACYDLLDALDGDGVVEKDEYDGESEDGVDAEEEQQIEAPPVQAQPLQPTPSVQPMTPSQPGPGYPRRTS